ncbi:TetR/AcrR family transcriptional regulator [Variovorax atrisoli]|uniref:TetR/AcrR family transcriptional regulator n=1 Tax=Variovorax atrisoli TaxID=3394203 RepID=UPI00035FF64A|nr:TetR/AcrR family transcriptional regulator [Variovorax paradoxus]
MATRPPSPPAPEPRAYHHGNLREALIEAAVELIERDGLDKLSVREAAKRAGVSPGAPFRHFATKTALLTAVAEQATQRLRMHVEEAVAAASEAPPLARFGAIGHAYIEWARANPTHFRVISERSLIDYDDSPTLRSDNEKIRTQMRKLFDEAFAQSGSTTNAADAAHAQIAARALVYGLARMAVDGHFPEWSLSRQSTAKTMAGTLDFFMSLLAGAAESSAEAAASPQKKKAESRTPGKS